MSSQSKQTFPGEQQLARWCKRLDGPQSFVYVIAGREAPPIKVGVAKDPSARLRSLQQGNWQRLQLLYVMPGSFKLEADFHRRLKEYGLVGEWFGGDGAEEFLEWIEDASRRAFKVFDGSGRLPSAMPPLRRLERQSLRSWGYRRSEMGHRWRTIDKPEQNPVTVKFVDPATLAPDPERRAQQERSQRNASLLAAARSAMESPFNPEADNAPDDAFRRAA